MALEHGELGDPSAEDDGEIRSLGNLGLSSFLPYLLNRTASSWNVSLQDQLRRYDLNTVRMRTLAVLTVSDGLSIKELVRLTVIEQSTLSRALDVLENQNLITRAQSDGDKRVRKVHITPLGRSTFEQFWPGMYREYQAMLAGIDDAEQAALNATLKKILKNLKPFDS